MLAGMVDYHLNLGRHFAYPHMMVDGAWPWPPLALRPQLWVGLPHTKKPLTTLAAAPSRPLLAACGGCDRSSDKRLLAPKWAPPPPPPLAHPRTHPPGRMAAGQDLLIVTRAAFAPWAKNSDAPLNTYYNNHNSNTIAFHRCAPLTTTALGFASRVQRSPWRLALMGLSRLA